MKCRWNGRGLPRTVPQRHDDGCPTPDECPGCLPCPEPHCCVCGRSHAVGACAECVAATRDDLRMIAALCDALPEEAEHRGVNGEAMMLLGPSSDPGAHQRRTSRLLAIGRCMHHQRGKECPDDLPLPIGPTCRDCDHGSCVEIRGDQYRCPEKRAWIEDARDEQHPVYILGSWEQLWRDHLTQPTDLAATLPRLVDYLDRHMHEMAAEPEVPFEDFARDLRGCRGHLEDVLRDQNQGDRAGVGCFDCGGDLERRLTEQGFEDHWTCQRCRRRYTYAEYNFALRASLEAVKEESA